MDYLFPDPKNFIGCKHIRKEEYGVFHRCADCRYHFCYDETKYSHPDQYKDCEHSVKDDIFGDLTCFRCGLRFTSIFSTCEHRRKKRFFDYTRISIVVLIVIITSSTATQNTDILANTKIVNTQTRGWLITNSYAYGVDSDLPDLPPYHSQKKKDPSVNIPIWKKITEPYSV